MIHSLRRTIPSFVFSQRAVLLVSFLIFQVFQVRAQCDPNSPYDKIVSGYHQSIALKSDGGFAVWGQAMAANGTSDVLTPIDLNVANYPNLVGTPLKATIGGAGSGTAEQAILLTSDGLYAWGSEGDVLANALTASGAFAKVTISAFDALTTNASTGLPTGVAPGDVVSMSASNQTLVILTRSGNVWVLSQMSTNLYGNAAGSLAANKWQKVKTNVSTDLANITAVRVQASSATYNAFIALSSTGTVYTWGSSVYLGDGNGPVAKNYATAMTIPVEFTSSNLPKIIGVTGGTKNVGVTNNSFYLLSPAGTLYVLGENGQRQLGTFDQVDALTWTQAERVNGTPFTNISFISVQEHDDSAPGVSAITSSGDLYTWGENEGLMLGRTTDGTFYDPAFPFGFTSGTDKALSSELGGHTLVYLKEGTTQFCYVGHKTNGSMGDGVSASSFISTFDCANTPSLSICGSVPVAGSTTTSTITASIRSILANGTTTSTITIQLKTAAGVNLTSSGGNVAVFTTAGTLGTVVNNNDGTYTVILTSASSAATAAITYTLNGSSGTNTESVAFTTISSTPTITSGGSLSTFTACAGTVSAEQSFTVGATDLTTDLIVTAPTGFELSLSSGGTFSASLTLSPSSGTVASTTIYIRLKSNASSASALDVVLSSTGATSVIVGTGASTVNVLPTVTGTTDGARSGTGTVSLSGTASSGATLDWYADLTGGSVLSGGTGVLSFTTPSISTTTNYFAQARHTTTSCISSSRTLVTASINEALSVGAISGDQTICAGSIPTTLTSTSNASGGTGARTYQWQASTDNSSFTDISSTNAATYSPGALSQTTYYRRGVYTGLDPVIYTASIQVTVSLISVDGTTSISRVLTSQLTGSGTPAVLTPWVSSDTTIATISSTGLVTPLKDGTTNITYTQSNGCSKTILFTVLTTDTDGDGVPDDKETLDGTDPNDGCSFKLASRILIPSDSWKSQDCDNDGISNFMECNLSNFLLDTDGDGVPNFLDGDSDNDGIPDNVERNVDSDGDKTADYQDLDSDNDGIGDTFEKGANGFKPVDTDKDGRPDYLDLDSDGDGLLDAWELLDVYAPGQDKDSNGIADVNGAFVDKNGNGWLDILENYRPTDTDKDGKPDYLDLDSDNDNISDTIEGTKDADNDRRVNFRDADSDGDGIGDIVEGQTDTDKDGVANYLDLDSDGDGILDSLEGVNRCPTCKEGVDSAPDGWEDSSQFPASGKWVIDTDKDGTPDYQDLDSDNDGIPDAVEAGATPSSPVDTDKDGVYDFRDLDSDNDGITDALEAGKNPATPVDTDKDGTPDFQELDSDNDGIPDAVEAGKDPANPVDTDKDGTPDYQDLDSDNDGIPDAVEAGKNPVTPVDTDKDGTSDYQDLDSDNDGIPDAVEAGKNPTTPVDTDKDGTPDYQDLDSDNDGIPDAVEAGKNPATPVDTDKDGTPDFQELDSDNDGIPDAVEAGKNPATPVDTDKDGAPDYQDLDSDNDGIPDAVEAGKNPAMPVDTDKDGAPDYQDLDSDNDGIPDAIEAGKDPSIPVDTDKDGTPDYQDLDSDNDGISDKIEAGADAKNPLDTDKDGIYDFRELDSDNDGLADKLEAGSNPNNPVDTDGDGLPDYRDLESDGDGIPDKIEAGANPASPLDTDGDGTFDFRDLDSDGDGLSDRTEAGANPSAPVDTDGDGKPDFQDIDSDGDGLLDRLEDDVNFGALPDCDRDGIPNRIDKDVCETYLTQGFSPNGDGVNDTFVIPGLVGMGNNKLTVFNRWGNMVFEADNYKNDWGGKTNNAFDPLASDGLLPDGVYYYVIDFNGSRPAMSNYLFINRLAK